MSLRRLYETTFIVNAALEDADIDAVIAKVTSYIENHGGEIKVVEKWGRRRLAYPINKKYNGFYVHIEFESMPNNLPILERFLVLEDTVLRHLTLILPEKLKTFRTQKALEIGKAIAEAEAEEQAKKEELAEKKAKREEAKAEAAKAEAAKAEEQETEKNEAKADSDEQEPAKEETAE